MYNAHVKTAEKATQTLLNDTGMNVSLEAAASVFRESASLWAETRMMTDDEAERFIFARQMEM